jgi:hypothetical protein
MDVRVTPERLSINNQLTDLYSAGWFLWVYFGVFGRECGQIPQNTPGFYKRALVFYQGMLED